jgi:AcrR family transcriptional regulator
MLTKPTLTTSATSLLASAKKLFWQYGIKRVSVEDICTGAGLSKMTFYRNFENKDAIAYELMRGLTEVGQTRFAEIMERSESLPARLREVIKMKLAYSQGISDEFLHDVLRSDDPKFLNLLEAQHKQSRDQLSHYLIESIGREEIDPNLNIAFVLFMVDDISNKMDDEAMVAIFPDPVDRIEHLISLLFFGISGQQNAGK